jgi:hypothetical protein
MSQKTTIRSGKTLGAFLDSVINESLKQALHQKALDEKENQQAAAGTQGGGDNSGGQGGGATPSGNTGGSGGGSGDGDSSKTMDADTEDKEKLQQGDITVKDVVEKLNAIRSGKSFKDSAVSGHMEEYVESLSKSEKTALLAFLKGISQIVTGEVPGDEAIEPDSAPANVDMEKKGGQHKTIKPNIIKSPGGDKGKVKGNEDTTSPAPITPKKRG